MLHLQVQLSAASVSSLLRCTGWQNTSHTGQVQARIQHTTHTYRKVKGKNNTGSSSGLSNHKLDTVVLKGMKWSIGLRSGNHKILFTSFSCSSNHLVSLCVLKMGKSHPGRDHSYNDRNSPRNYQSEELFESNHARKMTFSSSFSSTHNHCIFL